MVGEHHYPFEAGKFHHLSLPLHWKTNYGKMAEVNHDPEVSPYDHVRDQFVDLVKVVTGWLTEEMNFEFVQWDQVHSVEKTLDSSQLPQLIPFGFSEVSLLQKVASVEELQPKDVSVQQSVFPCNQTFSGNLKTEVIVVVVAEEVAEDVAVVVAAHCHVSWVGDEASDPENQRHGLSQCFRQLALFVEVQKA